MQTCIIWQLPGETGLMRWHWPLPRTGDLLGIQCQDYVSPSSHECLEVAREGVPCDALQGKSWSSADLLRVLLGLIHPSSEQKPVNEGSIKSSSSAAVSDQPSDASHGPEGMQASSHVMVLHVPLEQAGFRPCSELLHSTHEEVP